jgi:hypothetical protein
MEHSTSNWNGKGVRENPHTSKIEPATIVAIRFTSSFVLRAIPKITKPSVRKIRLLTGIFITQLVEGNIAKLLLAN